MNIKNIVYDDPEKDAVCIEIRGSYTKLLEYQFK